ncbi:unnamed protein product [Bursaphelenchus okinawaensis]|uniref:Uncharacterized protein n=1 Tax=Bursaphelenchus okinawaensis TaxID=465554 RepID=A0A811LIN1_9BILA|nr:unnamed protein product [Bursaphelenchus okinawaensis]CAG9124385.1 unnamed protein product [Bursaphelenchus okinawaensis]
MVVLPISSLKWLQVLAHATIFYGGCGFVLLHAARFIVALTTPFIHESNQTLVILPRIDADVPLKYSMTPLYEWRVVPKKIK